MGRRAVRCRPWCRAGRPSTPSSARPTTAGTSPAPRSPTSGCGSPSTRRRPRARATPPRTAPTPAPSSATWRWTSCARGEASDAPYFLEVALYAPHNRVNQQGHYADDPLFPPMFRDRSGRAQLRPGRVPQADHRRPPRLRRPAHGQPAAPGQRQAGPRLEHDAYAPRTRRGPRPARPRADGRSSADRLVTRILRTVGPNTFVVLTSDNGFHLGQQGMGRGKGTPYDTDVRVPLLVTGPGVVPGKRQEVTSNIDLAPTFEELAGLAPAPYRSGVSLVPTLSQPRLVRQSLRLPRAHAADADRLRPRRRLQRHRARPDPVLHRGAQPHGAARALRPRPAPRQGAVGLRVLLLRAATATSAATPSPTRAGRARSRS